MGQYPITDIIFTTYNRPECSHKAIAYILDRTRSPYRLHVVDDGSEKENLDFFWSLFRAGKIASLSTRQENLGVVLSLNLGVVLARSDVVVFTDDDVLCPDLEPDWLARGLAAMHQHPRLGIMALNNPCGNPQNKRRVIRVDGEITICGCVGATFMFVQREVLKTCKLDSFERNAKLAPSYVRCKYAGRKGWEIGYLTDVYCQHISDKSLLRRQNFPLRMEVVDGKTLEPPERWQW